jgi:predicted GNAT family acetyltransferase
VKSGYRGRGMTMPMIEAAVQYARGAGARIVEAYPIKAMPGDPGRGVLSTFLAAGFTVYAEERTRAKRNVVVRFA